MYVDFIASDYSFSLALEEKKIHKSVRIKKCDTANFTHTHTRGVVMDFHVSRVGLSIFLSP